MSATTFWIIIVIRAVFWGFLSRQIGKKKGVQNSFGIGAVFGLFGLIVILLRDDKNETMRSAETQELLKKLSDAEPIRDTKRWLCPQCKTFNYIENPTCKCGYKQSDFNRKCFEELQREIVTPDKNQVKKYTEYLYNLDLDEDEDEENDFENEFISEEIESEEFEVIESDVEEAVEIEKDSEIQTEGIPDIAERDYEYLDRLLAAAEDPIEKEIIMLLSKNDYSLIEIVQHFPREQVYEYRDCFFKMVDDGRISLKKYGKYSIW